MPVTTAQGEKVIALPPVLSEGLPPNYRAPTAKGQADYGPERSFQISLFVEGSPASGSVTIQELRETMTEGSGPIGNVLVSVSAAKHPEFGQTFFSLLKAAGFVVTGTKPNAVFVAGRNPMTGVRLMNELSEFIGRLEGVAGQEARILREAAEGLPESARGIVSDPTPIERTVNAILALTDKRFGCQTGSPHRSQWLRVVYEQVSALLAGETTREEAASAISDSAASLLGLATNSAYRMNVQSNLSSRQTG